MKTSFEIRNGGVAVGPESRAGVFLYLAPDSQEKQEIIERLHLDPYDLDSALDPDEVPRLECTPNRFFLILKRPKSVTVDQKIRFDVSSLGLFLQQDKLLVIMNEEVIPFSGKEFQGATAAADVLLGCILFTIHHYQSHVRAIRQLTAELESKIVSSMENRYLLQMFSLGESLVYYLDAIEANGAVLARLRTVAERLGFSKEEIESIDNIIQDNQQCSRQAQIYSTVLSGLMDARGTIVNNNMNVLLKNLTIINVVFLPLNLLASIGGMSEYSALTRGIDWRISYSLFTLGMVALGLASWQILRRVFERARHRGSQMPK